MARSQLVRDLDRIVAALRPELKARGFDWRGRDFTRATADGLTQVINFQTGERALRGKFTVNLGVFLPDVQKNYTSDEVRSPPERIRESYCHIRTRLARNSADRNDPWWSAADIDESIVDIRQRFLGFGLKFLERFESREKIFLNLPGEAVCFGPPKNIVLAMICFERGEYTRAREILCEYVKASTHRAHVRHVLDVAAWLGLDLAVEERAFREF